jgi:hypothetical protein
MPSFRDWAPGIFQIALQGFMAYVRMCNGMSYCWIMTACAHTSLDHLRNGTPIETYEEVQAAYKASLATLARSGSVEPHSRPGLPMPGVLAADVSPSTPTPTCNTSGGNMDLPPAQPSLPLFMPSGDDDAVPASSSTASATAPPPYAKATPLDHVSITGPIASKPSMHINTPRTPRRSYTPAVSPPLRSAFTPPNPLAHRKAYEYGSPSGLNDAIEGNSGVLNTNDVFGTQTLFATRTDGPHPQLNVRLDLGNTHVAGEQLVMSSGGKTATAAGPSARTITVSANRTLVTASYVKGGLAHLAIARSPMTPCARPAPTPVPPTATLPDWSSPTPVPTPTPAPTTMPAPVPTPVRAPESVHASEQSTPTPDPATVKSVDIDILAMSKRKRMSRSPEVPSPPRVLSASPGLTPTRMYSCKGSALPVGDSGSPLLKRIRLGSDASHHDHSPTVAVPHPAPPHSKKSARKNWGPLSACVESPALRAVTMPACPRPALSSPPSSLPALITVADLESLGITKTKLQKTVFGPDKATFYSLLPRFGMPFARLLGHLVHINHDKGICEAGTQSKTIFNKIKNRPLPYDAFVKAARLLQPFVFKDFNGDYLLHFSSWWHAILSDVSSPVAAPRLPRPTADYKELLWRGKNGFGAVVAALALALLGIMHTPLTVKVKQLAFNNDPSPAQFYVWQKVVCSVERVAAAMVASRA